TVRLFIMFASPPEQSLEWSDAGVEGAHRFLKRFWHAVTDHVNFCESVSIPDLDVGNLSEQHKAMRLKLHETIRKVSDDSGRRLTFNTAIAANMELLNALGKFEGFDDQTQCIRQECFSSMILMLAPIVPHICHQLWRNLGYKGLLLDAPWPKIDESALVQDTLELVVQVNGKLRGKIQIAANASQQDCQLLALQNEQVIRFLDGKDPKKVIVVPGRLINIVV
ncbi:MAG: leucyl-tRNA synthetase, partial [Gammaproteobacteria bacterium]